MWARRLISGHAVAAALVLGQLISSSRAVAQTPPRGPASSLAIKANERSGRNTQADDAGSDLAARIQQWPASDGAETTIAATQPVRTEHATDEGNLSGVPMGSEDCQPDLCTRDGFDSCDDFDPALNGKNPRSFLHDRVWFHGEYLMLWTKSADLPPLATTSPPNTPQAQAGVLGAPGTSILFGGGGVDSGIHSGGRFSLGYWNSPCSQEAGLEATYLFLTNRAVRFSATDQSTPILAEPYFNTETGQQDSAIVAFPGTQTGSLSVAVASALNSGEFLLRRALVRENGYHLDFLAGYRHARFTEDIAMDSSSTSISSTSLVPVGTVINSSDRFAAINEFNGAEIAAATQAHSNRWSLDLRAKLAMGSTQSRVSVNGVTATTVPQQPSVISPGGLFALPTNIGNYKANRFSVIPELGATLDYRFTSRLKATLGYTFLYWNRVARPGDQIDPKLNPSQFPPGQLTGAPAPLFKFVTSDFWAQGLNFGFEFQF